MKMKRTNYLMIGILSFSLISCTEEVTDALAENQPGEQQEQGQDGQRPGEFDQEYASTMQDNFGDYQMEEGKDCYHMYDDENESEYRLPQRRPMKKGPPSSQKGLAVDGSSIDRSEDGWEFETSPYDLVDDRGDGRMIGVHGDGAPIYGKYANSEESPELDENGGQFAPTDDFPRGIYHYVITLNIND